MNQVQSMRQSQQMAVTPQLLQQIRLLQLSRLELEQTLQTALETNVMLEADEDERDDDELSLDEAVDDDTPADEIIQAFDESWGEPARATGNDYDPLSRLQEDAGDAHTRIRRQIELEFRDPSSHAAALLLADACDDSGYLTGDYGALVETICDRVALSAAQVDAVLHRLQRLDPVGFASRSVAECLQVQLELLPETTPARALAMRIVAEGLEQLAAHDSAALAASFAVDVDAAHAAEQLILSLDPRPADQATPAAAGLYPDVVIRHAGSGWRVELARRGLPRLRINPVYERMLAQHPGAAGHQGMRDQLGEARWIVRGLEIRNDTLLRSAEVIFARQRAFLDGGVEALAPLTLREVADAIGMHESTVCRITNNKYVQTPRGVFELKFFFSSQLSRKDGSEIAGTAVRAMVQRLIEKEDRSHPLADGVIAQLLSRKGIHIARRTVAKYRDALAIPAARLRARTLGTQVAV